MSEDTDRPKKPFGSLHPRVFNNFGMPEGGEGSGGLLWLLEDSDRDRGFLSKRDRRFLLTANWDDELSDATVRNTRLRIRTRILATFFDAHYLKYVTPRDRRKVFQNIRDAGLDLQFRAAFKELIRFTYLGLLEHQDEIDANGIIETAIKEAHRDYAVSEGRDVMADVTVRADVREASSIEELERRYERHAKLSGEELAVLVNSWHEGHRDEGVDAINITLADALYYDARQPDSDPYGYSWADPDREAAEETVEWLRSFFREHEIDTYDELEIATQRLHTVDEELAGELQNRLGQLPRLAPNFTEQMATDSRLSEEDFSLLHDLGYNPDHRDVERILLQEVRPRTAGEDWTPAGDENLQKFIARVEVARSPRGVFGGVSSRAERWEKVKELADFDPDEWSDYMDDQRVEQCARELKELAKSNGVPLGEFRDVKTWEEVDEKLPDEGLWSYGSRAAEGAEPKRIIERMLDAGASDE